MRSLIQRRQYFHYGLVFKKTGMLIYPLVIFSFFYADEIMVLLYGNKYADAAVYFRIAQFANLFTLISYAPLILALGKTKYYSNVHMYGAIILVVLEYAAVTLGHSPEAVAIISVVCNVGRIFALLMLIASFLKVSILKGKKQYLPLIFVTTFIHGSFFLYIAIILVIYFFNRRLNLWLILLLISMLVSAVNFLDILHNNIDVLPKFLQNEVWSYTQSASALSKMDGSFHANDPLYARILSSLPKYYLNALVIILYLCRKCFSSSSKRLMGILIIWLIIVNFLSGIPSLPRFYALAYPILVYVWYLNWDNLKKYHWVIYLIPIVYSYKVLYWFRNMMSISVISTYMTPFPYIIWSNLF